MSGPDSAIQLLKALRDAGVDFVLVGGMAAVLQGAPVVTADLDIVHDRADANVDRLLDLLAQLHAYHRSDLARRRLPATPEQLKGHGHNNLMTDLGPLDVLCELAGDVGYQDLIGDALLVEVGGVSVPVLGLARLIQVKAATNRAKDRLVLPILVATLERQNKRQG